MLCFLTDGVNQLSFSLILATTGGTINGTAISRAAWMDQWRSELQTAGAGGVGIADAFRRADEEESYIHDDHLHQGLPRRIHLKDAFVSRNGPMLMRVSIDAVVGWSLGPPPPGGDAT